MFLLQVPFAVPESTTLLILFFLLAVWSVALVTVANSRFNDNTTKLCWFFIILFLNIIGALLFVFWGRKQIYQLQITKPRVK